MNSTILNVDDHEVNRYIRTQILQKAGYNVVEAATGKHALELCAAQNPALVLLDVNLPDMNGMEVCRHIKSISPVRTIVVHVSATYVGTAHQAHGLLGGADGYLCEPVDPELLLATVGAFLRLRDAEIKLQESQERLAEAQAIAGLTFWEWDVEADSVQMPGPEDSLVHIKFSDWLKLVDEEDRTTVEQTLRRACETLQTFRHEFRARRPDGTLRWIATKGRVFRDANRMATRLVGTNMEITERKKIELALQRSNEDLSQFAFMISHDLQEPLRTITTFTQLLSLRHKEDLNDEAATYMSFVLEGSRRMNAMITELLSFCHIPDFQMAPPRLVALETVFSAVLANVGAAIEESGAVIVHDPLPSVLGDHVQLTQVFQNLISNSLKYRKPDVPLRIEVTSRASEGKWILSIADNGIGFEQKHAESIFGMFKRLHGHEIAGTGIGLAVVKKVIERHGGGIWSESTPGEGARFTFTLPAA